MVLLQELFVHAGLGVEALDKSSRHHFAEVFVTGLVLAEQNQMVVAINFIYLIKAGTSGHIDLTADDGLDTRLFCSLVKLHTAVHNALFYAVHQLVNAAGTIQQTVFCMNMQVNKVSPLFVILARFRHAFTSSASCSRR